MSAVVPALSPSMPEARKSLPDAAKERSLARSLPTRTPVLLLVAGFDLLAFRVLDSAGFDLQIPAFPERSKTVRRSRFFSTLASLVVGLGSFASLLAAPAVARADGTKVLVLPYAPLYESIPRATGDRIATILEEGLSGAGSIQVVSLPREGQRAAKQASPEQIQAIAEASASVERGKELLQRRRVGPALQAFNRAIEQIEANVMALEDVEILLEAHLQKAATLFLMGREDEAAAGPMEKALLIKPDLILPVGETYGKPFVELLDEVRADIAKRGTGSLRVDTTPPGALVWVDGKEAPTSPVRITGLVPGVHYVKIKLPADPPYTERVVIEKDALFHITPDE